MASTTMKPDQYFFYDTETTGLDHTSQILQFGGILTDGDFNEIKRIERFCLPRPDVIPAVGAYLTHQIPLSEVIEKGVPEPEFARDMYSDMTEMGRTCSAGYNTHKFDDNRLRETFFRTNVDPYKREYVAENSRFDVFKMMKAVYALRPELINWPEPNEDGYTPMKLEMIAPLNDVVQTRAHDAMSDVEATIGVAKLVKDQDPKFFDYCLKLRNKSFAGDVIYNRPFMLVGEHVPQTRNYTCIGVPLCQHPVNKSSTICLDMGRVDEETMDRILSTPAENLIEEIFNPDFEKRLPIFEVKVNQLPFVFTPAILKNNQELADRAGIDFNETMNQIQTLQNDERFNQLRLHAFEGYKHQNFETNDVYSKIYDGFTKDWDRKKLLNLSTEDYGSWCSIADTVNSDNRIKPLTVRAVGNIDVDLLPEKEAVEFKQWMGKRYNDLTGEYGETLPKFWVDAKEALESEETSEHQKSIVKELVEHTDFYAKEYAPEIYNNKEKYMEEEMVKRQEEKEMEEPEAKPEKKKASPSPSP